MDNIDSQANMSYVLKLIRSQLDERRVAEAIMVAKLAWTVSHINLESVTLKGLLQIAIPRITQHIGATSSYNLMPCI